MDLGIVWGLLGGPLGVYSANFRRNIFPIFSGSAFSLQGPQGWPQGAKILVVVEDIGKFRKIKNHKGQIKK